MMMHSSKRLSEYLETQIACGAFPGAQYVVGEDQQIIMEGAVGFAVVEPERIEVNLNTIYDLASLTKPLVTSLLAVIFAALGTIDLNAPLGQYLDEFDEKRKRRITLTQLLTHVSGLPNWRPLYLETSDPADVPAYIAGLLDDSPDAETFPLVYSDLNYILLAYALERVSGERLDRLAQKHIFDPLNLKRTMFNPSPDLKREIAATEHGQTFEQANAASDAEMQKDKEAVTARAQETGTNGSTPHLHNYWRKDIIWGEVHDGNAYYLGGVAGHAGLFSIAREVFQIANQFLRGSSLVSEAGLQLFAKNLTNGQETARSISWILASSKDCSAGPGMPQTAMGHTGFTGTSVWMDPDKRRVFVLLTNRIHPHVSTFDMKEVRRQFNTLAVEELG
jgi:CubicO group peptidase (beta-lactamase class C family)